MFYLIIISILTAKISFKHFSDLENSMKLPFVEERRQDILTPRTRLDFLSFVPLRNMRSDLQDVSSWKGREQTCAICKQVEFSLSYRSKAFYREERQEIRAEIKGHKCKNRCIHMPEPPAAVGWGRHRVKYLLNCLDSFSAHSRSSQM